MQQLKYATDEDFLQVGLSRPEVRRLRKIFHKHCPQNYLYKFKNVSKDLYMEVTGYCHYIVQFMNSSLEICHDLMLLFSSYFVCLFIRL